ncbi:MAG: protein translocase subunit SecD [Acidimicrobiia bacterium]|nr:protein translocase subunit SecD [Acidimicrobiia bacterium]
MMSRGAKISSLSVVAAAVLGIIYTVVAGNQPLLGLDLQGGVSVVLEPTTTSGDDVTDESLNLTVELLRGRIDEIGVAEPEISRQGTNIVVALPGVVDDQEQALERLQQTAELRFRPVIFDLGPDLSGLDLTDEDGNPINLEDLTDEDGNPINLEDLTGEGTDGTDTTDQTVDEGGGDEEGSMAGQAGRFSPLVIAQDETTSTTTADESDGSTSTTAAEGQSDATPTDTTDDDLTVVDPSATPQSTLTPDQLAAAEACSIEGVTPDNADEADAYVVLDDRDGNRLCLGPTMLTGEVVETADVSLGFTGSGWEVNPVFRPGAEGIDQFNAAARTCYAQNPDPNLCPSGRLAIVLDHQVISAPSINAETFARDQIVISGTFEEEEARLLAEALRFGALPLELQAQEIRTVSATIGHDVLDAGVTAGIIGLILVAIYLLAYYRLAGLVAISGLALSGALLWTIVAWFGDRYGLALSLAGVVGLIVAIGVSADSNIVYFENVKESYMSGRRVPTAIERAYQSAISTIVKADVVSLIAAVLLYWLTVGAVRGFAFYLGLATILDLVISWMFMRPALAWLARRRAVEENPRLLGLPSLAGGSQ